MTVPLLQCDDARVDVAGVPLVDGLSCVAERSRVGLVGNWDALFRLLAGQAELRSGSVLVHGHPVARAVADGVVGLGWCSVSTPSRWTARQYLEHSGRLLGMARGAAREQADVALERAGLGALGRRPLGGLAPVERRAVLLVHAVLGDPAVIALQTPLLGLDEAWASHLVQVIERMAGAQRWLISVSESAPGTPERALLDRLDEVLVQRPGGVVSQGSADAALGASRCYLVVVTRQAASLTQRLRDRGLGVDAVGIGAGAARLVVELGDAATTDSIIEAALDADAPIIELVPLGTS